MQIMRVLKGNPHTLKVPENEWQEYIRNHSYFDYLKITLGVDDPGVLRMARHSALDWALSGTDAMTIGTAKNCEPWVLLRKLYTMKTIHTFKHFGNGGKKKVV